MSSWVKEKGRPPGLGFDPMRERVCQSQRRKREAEHKFNPASGRAIRVKRRNKVPENHLTQKEKDFIRVKRKNRSISFWLQAQANKEQRMNHKVKKAENRE